MDTMKLKLPVLNKKDNWKEHQRKLLEEATELQTEIAQYINNGDNLLNLTSETLDVMQICVGILDDVRKQNKNIIKLAAREHIRKLDRRGWKFNSIIRLEED